MTFILNFTGSDVTPTQSSSWDNQRQFGTPQYIPCVPGIPCGTTIQIGVAMHSPENIFSFNDLKVIHIPSKKIFNVEGNVISSEKGKIKNFDRTQIK